MVLEGIGLVGIDLGLVVFVPELAVLVMELRRR
jgi:hypothetical protein